MLTIYGRKPVLETLQDKSLACHALHLAESNREAGIVADIRQCAQNLGIPIKLHSREALARISKNGKQDQGVAIDVLCPSFQQLQHYLSEPTEMARRLLALDGINNPQNLGMIIRSAAAGQIDGIILPAKRDGSSWPSGHKGQCRNTLPCTVANAPCFARRTQTLSGQRCTSLPVRGRCAAFTV